MTNTTADIRDLFHRAVATSGPVIEQVGANQLSDPTPCRDFDVQHLADHLIQVAEKLPALARGDAPSFESVTYPHSQWSEIWAKAAADNENAWEDDSLLSKPLGLGWAQMTGSQTLHVYLNEVVVHTWDLAKATRQQVSWDDETLRTALDAIQAELPAEPREDPVPFDAVVEVPNDAPMIDRLVAWNGRQP